MVIDWRLRPGHNMVVPRRAAHLIIIVALLLQCSPVQVCAFEAMAYGANCHDAALSSDVHDTPAPDPAEHHCPDPCCGCDAPKSPLDSGGGRTFISHPHLTASLPAPDVNDPVLLSSPGLLPTAPASLASPPADRVFPLLI